MTAFMVAFAATFLAQAPGPSTEPAPTERFVVYRRNGEREEFYGRVLGQPAQGRLRIQVDAPWDPKPEEKFVDEKLELRERERESPQARERRIRREFESRDLAFVGGEYDKAENWVPKADLEYARKAQQLVREAEEKSRNLAVAAATDTAAASPDPAPGPSPFAFRLLQLTIGVVAIVLVGIVAKVYLL